MTTPATAALLVMLKAATAGSVPKTARAGPVLAAGCGMAASKGAASVAVSADCGSVGGTQRTPTAVLSLFLWIALVVVLLLNAEALLVA